MRISKRKRRLISIFKKEEQVNFNNLNDRELYYKVNAKLPEIIEKIKIIKSGRNLIDGEFKWFDVIYRYEFGKKTKPQKRKTILRKNWFLNSKKQEIHGSIFKCSNYRGV